MEQIFIKSNEQNISERLPTGDLLLRKMLEIVSKILLDCMGSDGLTSVFARAVLDKLHLPVDVSKVVVHLFDWL